MRNDYLDTQFLINENPKKLVVGQLVTGEVIFTPKINLHISSLGYQLVMMRSSPNVNREKVESQKLLLKNKRLIAGKTYRYNVKVKMAMISSYDGRYIDIFWELRTSVKLHPNTYLKIRNDYLKKKGLNHFYDTKLILNEKLRLNVRESNLPLHIEMQKAHLSESNYPPLLWFVSIMIAASIFLQLVNIENASWIWLGCLFTLFVIILLPHWIKKTILDNIQVKTISQPNNQFSVSLDLTKNWKRIRKVRVKYFVKEKVREKAIELGTNNDVVYNTTLYESPDIVKYPMPKESVQILDFPEVKYDFTFDFPKDNLPVSYRLENLNLNWDVEIYVYYSFGLRSKFVKELDVERST